MQRARALLRAAKADVTRASLQVALLYLFAEHVKAQNADLHAEASEKEAEELITETEALELAADQSEEELDPEQAAAQLRALIDEELAVTAEARGIDPELRLAMDQASESAQTQSSSPDTLQANSGSEGASKGFEWTDLKIGESGFSPFVVMGGGLLFNSLLAGGGSAAVVAKAVLYANGIVADGYISGSIVKLLDANGKVIASTTTDASGRYSFDDALLKQASKVVASGGVDTSTGLKFEIELSAPSGATVINPLTTLVQSFIEANPGMSAAKAMQSVRSALGIPDSQDLLTLDPIAAAISGTAEQKSLALALQIKAAQVANLLVTASSAMRASDPGLSLQDAMGKIIGGLTQQIANVASGAQKPFVLNDVSIITSVTGLKGDAVLLIAEGNTISADSLDGIYEFQKLVQDDLSNILSLGGSMSAEALKSLTALLKFVSQGNKVVDFKLAPSSDTSLNESGLLTHVADPSVRVDLKPLADTVKVGDTIKLTQEGREPTTVIVTPEDVSRGYVDIKLPTFTQDGSATITVTVTDSQTQKDVAKGVVAITYDSTVTAIGAQIAPHTDSGGGEGKPNVMITVTGLEAGAVWQYSLDNGKTWSAQISGPSTPVAAPQGAFVLTLRQIDKAGNESAPSQIKFEYSAGNFAPALTGPKAVLVDGVEDVTTIIKASDLLKGYSDAENQKLSIVNLTAKGDAGLVIQVVANNDGTYTLTAPANYNGAVVLSYGVTDGVAVTAANQQINIKAVNDAAVLSSAAVALDETNAALTTSGKLTISDVDSAQTFVLQTNAAGEHGKFSIDAQGNWTYTANTALNSLNVGDSVSDTFTVASADGTKTSVKVTINGTNDAPTLTSQAAILSAGVEDTVYTFTAAQLLQGYSDVDGGTLSVTNVTATHGTLTDDGKGTYTFTPDTNYNGPVALSYTISDGQGGHTAVEQSFSLSANNDAPALTGSKASLVSGTEDQTYIIRAADLLAGYSDADLGTLSVTELLADHGQISDNQNGTYTFTPTANYNGTVTLSYRIADGQGGHTAASQSLSLNSVNDAPALTGEVADLINGQEGQAYVVSAADLLKGYTDVEGDALSVGDLSANHGSVIDNGNGTYTITPDTAYAGLVTLSYQVVDAYGAKTAASQSFGLTANNVAPALTGTPANLAAGQEDNAYTVRVQDLLTGYSDQDGGTLAVENLRADHGQVQLTAPGVYTITPDANYNGTLTLSYKVVDGQGGRTNATQTVTLDSVNDAPALTSLPAILAAGTEDQAYQVTAAQLLQGYSDVDGGTLSVGALIADHGTVKDNGDGTYTITPTANYNGPVTLTYKVLDGQGAEKSVSQSFSLNSVNDAPILTSQTAILSAGVEDTVYTFTAAQLLQGYSDVDGGTLSVTNVTAVHGTLTDDGKGTYTFTPDTNYNGPVALSYTISDGQGGHTAVEQSFSLSATNDAPALTGSKASLVSGTEDQTYIIRAADLLAGYSDADLGTLNVTELLADHGQITDNQNGTYTFTPTANYNGTVTLSYRIADGQGGHTAASQSLSLNSVNDAPALTGEVADLINGQEGQAYVVSAADLLKGYTDVEGDALSVGDLSANHGSVIDNGNGTYTITPDTAYAGLVTLSYQVVDAYGAKTAASQSFGLTANNVAPALTGTPANLAAGQEDNAYTVRVQDLLTGYSDQDGGTLAVENLRADHGQVQLTAPGVYTITPDANYNGTLTLSYKVVDGQGGRTNATQTVTLDSVNDAPALTSLPAILDAGTEDQAYQVTAAELLQGYSDVDGGTLSVGALIADHGTVKDNGDGTFTITPAANYNGPVTLTYKVLDGQGAEKSVSQSFSLNSVNDAPILTSQTAILSAGVEDTVYTFTAAQLLQGYSDVDGGTLSVTNVTAVHGTLTDDGKGTYTFTPDTNYNGPVALSYTISDGQGGHTAVEQSFSLSAVNDAPNLEADTLRIAEGSSQSSLNLLTNDNDVEGSPLSIAGISNANQDAVSFDAALNVFRIVTNHGVLTLGVDGSYSYSANGAASVALNAGEKFTETFTYTVTDGVTTSSSTLKVTIDGASTVIDGYVQNATVFYDLNNNQKQDDGEATATTDEFGRYSVSVDTPLSGGRWVSTGGTDSFSGEVVGYLFAPAGSSVITPLTTLLAFGPEAQHAAIEANMLKVLGLDTLLADAGISSVTGFDPMAAIVSPMDGANLTVLQQAGAAVFASQQVIMTLMQTAIKLGSVDNVVQGIQTSFEKLAKDIELGSMDGAETAEGRLALLHALNHEVIATIIAQSTTIPDSLKADLTLSVSGMLNHVTDALMANFEALALQLYKSAQGLELSVDDQLSIALAKATVASAQTSLLNAISEVLKSENPLQVAAGFGSAFDAQIENSANGSVDLPVPGNLLSVAAAKAYIAQGVDVSGRTLDASSITLADYQSLHKVAGLLLTNGVEINVTDRGVRGYSDEIDSLLGERGLDAVLNLGASADVAVTIDETQAMGLINAGLHFAAGDTITLNADNAEGTHLGASLKQLSKLGVDTVALSAAGTELAFGEGSLSGALPNFSDNGNVTLNVNGQDQLGQAAGAASQLDAAGIDTVQINLLDGGTTNGGNAGYSDELNALLGTSGLSNLSTGMDAVLNLGGNVNETVTIDETQAMGLINAGLHFAAGDTITLNADNAEGTHLGASLKQLSKLGVDTVAVSAAGTELAFGEGALSGALPSFSANGQVTLNVNGQEQLGQAAGAASQLDAAGIDTVQINLLDGGTTNGGNAGYSDELNALLGTSGLANLSNGMDAVLNLGGSVNETVTIDETQAMGLINAGLHFAAGDTITLNADNAEGTHLGASLKQLSKLGVDTVAVSAAGTELSFGEGALSGALPSFSANGNVTLNVNGQEQLGQAAGAASQLDAAGIDTVQINLLDGGTTNGGNAGYSDELNALLGTSGLANLSNGMDAVLNLGGSVNETVTIDETQAMGLINAGLHFAAGDTITLNADNAEGTHLGASLKQLSKLGVDTVAVSAAGTELSFGEGALSGALPGFSANGNVTLNVNGQEQLGQAAGAASQLDAAGIDTVQINLLDGGTTNGGNAGYSDELNTLLGTSGLSNLSNGMDAVLNLGGSVNETVTIDETQAMGLINAGLHFAAGDTITLNADNAEGTHLGASLKQLSKLGVDTVALSAAGTELAFGEGALIGALPGFSANGNVTLNVNGQEQLGQAAGAASQLDAAGIDTVQINLLDGGTTNGGNAGYSDELNALLGTSGLSNLSNGMDAVLNLGGNVNEAVTIDETQAMGLINAGLHFAAGDTITLNADNAEGTHLGASLKQLSKLGVDAVALSAAGTELAFGEGALVGALPSFSANGNVTLNVNGQEQLGQAAGAASQLDAAGIDTVQINLLDGGSAGYSDELNALLGTSGLSNLSNGMDAVLNLGGSVNETVTIDETQAMGLINAGLHFAAGDTITLNADNAEGTHLGASLKQLSKLGVDTVAVSAAGTELAFGEGALSSALPNFSDNGNVTLNVNGQEQLGQAAGAASQLDAAGIDTVQINLLDGGTTNGGNAGYSDELNALLGTSGLSNLSNGMDAVLNLGGNVNETVTIDETQAMGLINAGLHFAAGDTITLNADNAEGTHLGASLKQLSKLGVDTVAVSAAGTELSFGEGSLSGALPSFSANGNVTLNVNGQEQLGQAAGAAAALDAAGIDTVQINLLDGGNAGYSDELNTLLGTSGLSNLSNGMDAVLNLGGNVNETVTIDETQAMGLINAGLHFAAGDTITLNADNAEGTHLGASLKQLSKLGVDTVAVSAAGTELSFGEGSLSGALPSFSANGNVTLNVNGQEQLGQAAGAAAALDAAGIDTVQINLLDGGTTNGGNAGYSDELNALLGTSGLANLSNGMDAVLNLGGSVNETVTIDETQAMGLINAGLHFAAGDTITLNADNAEGTHLGASLKQLSKLGVDTVAVSAAGTELSFGEGALSGALPSFSANGNVTLNVNGQEQLGQAAGAAAALDAAGIDTVQINLLDGGRLNGGVGYSDELNALLGTSGLANLSNGMDAVLNLGGNVNETVTIDETQAMGLINAGLHFAAGDTITLNADNAEGTHLGASLKQLSKLGVDTVAVSAAGTELAFGEGALSGALPGFSANGNVTLNVNGQEQLGQAARAASQLDAAGIDTVQINVAPDYLSSVNDQSSLNVLTGDLHALLSAGLDVAFANGATVLDMHEQVSLSGDQAAALIHSGIQFAADDYVTLHVGSNAEATHLQSSLKDLQKLGVDAITVADGVTALTFNADGAQLGDEWGSSVLSIQATDANVNLSFSSADSFGSFAHQSAIDSFRLADVGVDQLTVALQDQGQGGYQDDVQNIANGLMNFGNNEGVQVVLDAAGASSVELSLGGINAAELIGNGVSFASGDQISIDAQTYGTHLTTSLKDLQKLGIDAVNTAGLSLDGLPSDVLHVTLGSSDIALGGLAAIGDNNNDGVLSANERSDLQVTLNLGNVDEIKAMQALASGLHEQTGIDAVEFDLTYQGADRVQEIVSGLNAVADEGLAMHAVVDGTQASALIEQGFNFAESDQVGVLHDYAQGTHLGSSLKDLQKLGVDAVAVSGGVTVALGEGTWGSSALPAIGDSDMNGVLSREERDGTNVTLEARLNDLGDVLSHATDLVNQAGVDAISLNIASDELDMLSNLLSGQAANLSALDAAGLSVNAINVDGSNYATVNIDQGLAETLIHAGLQFAADDQIDLHATGTFIKSSLQDLQKLGVDAVTLSATDVADITDGSIPSFSAIAQMGFSVSLNVATGDELSALSTLAQSPQTDGEFSSLRDLTGIQSIELAGDAASLEAMLSEANGNLTQTLADVQVLRNEGFFPLDTIDVAGAMNAASLTISDGQASALVAAGLHFAADDHITVDAALGTHLQTSLRDLQKLGVDALNVVGSTLDMNLGVDQVGSLAGLPSWDNDNLSVTLHGQADQIASLAYQANGENISLRDQLGIDAVNVAFTTEYYGGLNDAFNILNAQVDQTHTVLSTLQQNNIDVVLDAYGTTSAHVDVWTSAQSLISAGLSFAQEDHINLVGVSNADGTHITTSLKDLQKLGVDTVNSMPALGMNIDLGTTGTLNAAGIPSFDDSLDLSLNLDKTQNLSEIQDLASALADAGIDHITLSQDQMLTDVAATQALISAGIDFNVLVGSAPAVSNMPDTLDDIFNIVKDGVDVLGNMLTQNASMGELVNSLGDAGIHRIDIDKPAQVSIGDDLAAALYEAGMLTALPEAGVQIDAGAAMQLQTSLSAMANLGVDHVVAQQGAQVNLGAQFSEYELANLLGHFVDDDQQGGIKPIFDHGAELNMGQTTGYTEETLQSLLQSGMGSQLQDLGISKVVAQVQMPPVEAMGGSVEYTSMEFDLDILIKKPGQI